MHLSKQHKIYGLVLGLALAALGADRVFSSSPAPTETTGTYAAAPATSHTSGTARVAATKAAGVKPGDSASIDDRRAIAARLDELAITAGLNLTAARDAFTPSPAWVGTPTVAAAPAAVDEGRAREQESARRFVAEHRLTAVMGGGSRNVVAIVDGKPLRPGQTLDGFTLVSVSARDVKAVFEHKGGTPVELRLKQTGEAATVAQAN